LEVIMRFALFLSALLLAAPAHGQPGHRVVASLMLGSAAPSAPGSLLVLSVASDGQRFLGSSRVPARLALADVLRSNVRIQKTGEIGLLVHGKLPAARLVALLGELRAAGLKRVFLLGPDEKAPAPRPKRRKPGAR
jgi:biopolymer transport protein ExbD